jgi:hypothetical protein
MAASMIASSTVPRRLSCAAMALSSCSRSDIAFSEVDIAMDKYPPKQVLGEIVQQDRYLCGDVESSVFQTHYISVGKPYHILAITHQIAEHIDHPLNTFLKALPKVHYGKSCKKCIFSVRIPFNVVQLFLAWIVIRQIQDGISLIDLYGVGCMCEASPMLKESRRCSRIQSIMMHTALLHH